MQKRSLAWSAGMLTWITFFAASVAHAQQAPAATFNPRDLSGVWLFSGLRTLSNNPPVLTPEGKAKFDANKPSYGPRAIPPALGNDPMGKCDPIGLVRSILYPRNREIFQVRDRVLMIFEWNRVYREIWTDGRALPTDPAEWKWYGYSVGRWEGDTLVVDTIGLNDGTWLDQFGNTYTTDMRLEERYRRVSQDTIEFTMTLTDPKTYTTPWVSERKVLRLQKEELREEICAPSVEEEFNRRLRNPAGGVTNGRLP
jgi:hypothetical protein